MKNLKSIALLFIIMLVSCTKKDNPTAIPASANNFPEENPLSGYLNATGFNEKTDAIQVTTGALECGYGFKPKFKGKINAFVVKIPLENTTLKVTLWDIATQTAIKTETINATAATEVVKIITPIELQKDKEYGISINTTTFYNHERTNGTAATYPVAAGNLEITRFANLLTALNTSTLPTTEDKSYYAGDVSFKFQRTE
jgi:hypothetical protein